MKNKITTQEVFECTSNGVVVTDIDGRVVLINHNALKKLKTEKNGIIGKDISDVLQTTGHRVFECLKTGREHLGQVETNGRAQFIVNITPIIEGQEIIGAVINFQPIQQFENSARRLESFQRITKQLEIVFETSFDGIWICDGSGKILALNRASERLNGVRADEVIGKNVEIMIQKNIVDSNITPDVIRTRQSISKMQFIKRTGRYLMVTGNPAFDEGGNLILVVVNERDMTQLNTLQKKLEKTRLEKEKISIQLEEMNVNTLKGQNVIAENKKMRQIYHTTLKLSQYEVSNILILGETGTGKGLMSKFIYRNSPRVNKAFIQINCAALPESLLEAELFGYEKGAFTGARAHGKVGRFELAHNGILFLDEIGDMPISIQAKLLTYLDDYEIVRLGGTRPIKIDCLILAATNQNLERLVKAKKFRRDLYHRLNSFTIQIPPLIERPEDTFELTHHYLAVYNRKYRKRKIIRSEGIKALQNHAFPGNVRELKNIIKEAVVLCEAPLIDQFVIDKLEETAVESMANLPVTRIDVPFCLQRKMNAFEKQLLSAATKRCHSTNELARTIEISQATAFRKMKKHGLSFQK